MNLTSTDNLDCIRARTATEHILGILNDESLYDKDIRPAVIGGGPVVVSIVPNRFILLTMDQQMETIEYFCEFMLMWKDPKLSWDIGGDAGFAAEWIKIPEKFLWTPDIVFGRSLSDKDMIDKKVRWADMRNDGTVRKSGPAVIESKCELDIRQFPYDYQTCIVTMGSWSFDRTEIYVQSFYPNITIDEEFFVGNNEWDLETIVAIPTAELWYGGNFSIVNYQIDLKRRPVYYVLVIQAPAFIIGTLTLFGIFMPFSVHGERRERVTLGLTMLLSISMTFELVSDMMPKASRLPLLG